MMFIEQPEDASEDYPGEETDEDDACQLVDHDLMKLIVDKDHFVCQFFRLLALCHTVMPEERDGEAYTAIKRNL